MNSGRQSTHNNEFDLILSERAKKLSEVGHRAVSRPALLWPEDGEAGQVLAPRAPVQQSVIRRDP